MSLMDFGNTAEDIQEDEEMIKAVEHLVETCAVSVWSDICADVDTVQGQVQRILHILFPALIRYQRDATLIQEDLEKLLIFLMLFVVAFGVLRPSRKAQQRTTTTQNHRAWFVGRTSSTGEPSSAHYNNSSSSLPHKSQSEEESESSVANVEETDEERFEKTFASIQSAKYKRLVLPPSCRLVEKPSPKEKKRESERSKKDTDAKKQESDDDDNPAQRLQTYGQHVFYFLRSILYYDYAGAGWTLILWMQGIQRYRRTTSAGGQVEDEDDNDNEDGDGESQASLQSEDPSTPRHENGEADTPFATPLVTPVKEPASDGGFEGSIKKRGLLTPLEEEKKESPSLPDESPPPLPNHGILKRSTSSKSEESVYHEMSLDPNYEVYDSSAPHSPGVRKPKLQQRSSGKGKDALDSYRLSHEPNVEGSPLNSMVIEVPASAPAKLPAASLSRQDAMIRSPSENSTSAKFFFETANSQDSLKKLSVEIPVPDKNGYILGDAHLFNNRYTPLLVFVNSRAGPQQGHLLLLQLRVLLNPIQVWDLADGGPEAVLESFCVLTRLRILVCGGDGTVSWIISTLEKMNLQRKWPPISILPLGTGNDLARIHGWGGGYNNESLLTILEQISESYISLLDRWEMTVEDSKGKVKQVKSFFNYLGVGADAQAALQVHYLRESRPDWFFSRLVNKAWYGIFGAEDIIKASSVNVRKEITLFADGVEIPLPPDSQGIIVLNIDSYAGGVPLWSHGNKCEAPTGTSMDPPHLQRRGRARRAKSMSELHGTRSHSMDRIDSRDDLRATLSQAEKYEKVTACEFPSSCQDGVLDIVSIRGAFHLGQIKVGLSTAQKVCQCREVRIVIKKKVAVQIDGEPWRQNTCTLRVKRKKAPAVMLHRSADDGGVELEMSKLLDWAEERKLIDGQVHSMLMKEFSRRIEKKTRQRRLGSQDHNIMHTLKRAAIGSTGAISNLVMPGAQQPQGTGGISF